MATSEHKYLSDFANKYYGEGKAEGQTEGETKHAREALLIVIAVRGIAMSEGDHARVEACTDPRTLDAWLARAAQATTAADVFGS